MVSRLRRDRPLPEVSQSRVDDSKTQRALDAITTSLKEVVALLQPLVQSNWYALTAFSDWGRGSTANKPAQYTKDLLGYVVLRGETKTVAGTSTTLGILPVGFRPPVGCNFPVTVYNGAIVTGRLDVQSGGRLVLTSPAVAANIEVYLDGIRFSLEA